MSDHFVFSVEIAEKSCSGAKALTGGHRKREIVNMGRNPPDIAPAARGDEELRPAMAEKGILGRIDQFQLFAAQLRHEMGQATRKGAPQIDKARPPALVGDRDNSYLACGKGCVCQASFPVLRWIKAFLVALRR